MFVLRCDGCKRQLDNLTWRPPYEIIGGAVVKTWNLKNHAGDLYHSLQFCDECGINVLQFFQELCGGNIWRTYDSD